MTMTNKNIVILAFFLFGLLSACSSPKPLYIYVSNNFNVSDSVSVSHLIWENRKYINQKLNPIEKEKYNFLFAGSQLFHTNTFEIKLNDTIPFFPVLSQYSSFLILDKMINKELVYTYIYIPKTKIIASYATRWHNRIQFGPKEVGTYKDLQQDIKDKIEKGKPFMISNVTQIQEGKWNIQTKVFESTK